jgi:hypothetical protein
MCHGSQGGRVSLIAVLNGGLPYRGKVESMRGIEEKHASGAKARHLFVAFLARLSSFLKKSKMRVELRKSIPQGLKPQPDNAALIGPAKAGPLLQCPSQ